MRDFLNECLYQRHTGYFDSHPNLITNDSNSSESLWFTPSTIARPLYAQSMLSFIMRHNKLSHPLIVYEIGAGSGAFAFDFMSLLNKNHPEIYHRCEYHIVEKSASLMKLQQKHLIDQHVYFHHYDIVDAPINEKRPCFIFALEVLDNVPQDIIKFHQNQTLQGSVQFIDPNQCSYSNGILPLQLYFKPVSDELILKVLSALKKCNAFQFKSKRGAGVIPELGVSLLERIWPLSLLDWHSLIACYHYEFIPTGIWSLLSSIIRCKFQMGSMLVSDFSWLPETIPGHQGSPLVQAHHKQKAVAITDILHQPGTCDVMFPIDFDLLKQMIGLLGGRNISTYTHQEFLKEHLTNPPNTLLNSYSNYSVLHFDF